MSKSEPRHRCAVCWEWADSHEEWQSHAETVHGAVLAEFGFTSAHCQQFRNCPGIDRASKMPNFGTARVPRARPEPRPFTAKDGTVYTPVPLPVEPLP